MRYQEKNYTSDHGDLFLITRGHGSTVAYMYPPDIIGTHIKKYPLQISTESVQPPM